MWILLFLDKVSNLISDSYSSKHVNNIFRHSTTHMTRMTRARLIYKYDQRTRLVQKYRDLGNSRCMNIIFWFLKLASWEKFWIKLIDWGAYVFNEGERIFVNLNFDSRSHDLWRCNLICMCLLYSYQWPSQQWLRHGKWVGLDPYFRPLLRFVQIRVKSVL